MVVEDETGQRLSRREHGWMIARLPVELLDHESPAQRQLKLQGLQTNAYVCVRLSRGVT